tara:strand:+ start:292 stop:1773 length:1482 start_codon:yes stop_codon:yes gene_type:complete
LSGKIGGGVAETVFNIALLSQSWKRLRIQLFRSTASLAGISLLVSSGWIGVQLTNRQQHWADHSPALSLAQLSSALILVQSFRGDPKRAVPSLWSERLGLEPAIDLWRRYGRSMWWQGWSQDGDAYLILSSSTFPSKIQGLERQRVGSMEVLASDALHRQQLLQGLKTNQVQKAAVPHGSLLGACFQGLLEGPGVIWNADALATLSGTLAPLLQQGREGCVQLRLQSNQIRWDGVIGRRPLSSLTQLSSGLAPGYFEAGPHPTSTSSALSDLTLLQVDGQHMDLILGTLLSRQIIQAPLEEHYGINGSMRNEIADLPFSLRLQSRANGAYKAGLQVQLPLSTSRQQWTAILNAVSDRLGSSGFQKREEDQPSPNQESPTLWQLRDDSDQTTVGGWEIIQGPTSPVLSIGFGTEPAVQAFLTPLSQQQSPSLRVTGDPKRLTQLGLLGGLWPKPVQTASSLNLEIRPLNNPGNRQSVSHSWWRVSGSLTLTPDS